jgi:hypothetical protein
MTSAKYIGMDVHKESISIAVLNSVGKVVTRFFMYSPRLNFLSHCNNLTTGRSD